MAPERRPDGRDGDAFIDAFFQRSNLDRADFSEAETAEFYDNDFLALSASLRDRPPLEDIPPTKTMPCLLHAGEGDGNLAGARRCAEAIPGALFIAIPDLNHPETFYRSDLVLYRRAFELTSRPTLSSSRAKRGDPGGLDGPRCLRRSSRGPGSPRGFAPRDDGGVRPPVKSHFICSPVLPHALEFLTSRADP